MRNVREAHPWLGAVGRSALLLGGMQARARGAEGGTVVAMPLFEPFTEGTVLPDVGAGYEHAMLDLKRRVDTGSRFHIAKDIAAFANHLGGTLLIGAEEKDGHVGRYHPLDQGVANECQKATSEAVRDRCSPRPLVDFVRISRDDGVVLAVNAWPYIGQPVGVAVKCKKDHDGFGDDAYVFPVRTGVDSVYLLPEQLPMFMLPEVRRVTILLHAIPRGERVVFRVGLWSEGVTREQALMGEVDERQNVVSLIHPTTGQLLRGLPLDQIMTIYKDPMLGWFIGARKYE